MPQILSCVFSTDIASLGPFLTVALALIFLVNLMFFGYLLKSFMQKRKTTKQQAHPKQAPLKNNYE